MRVSGNGGKTPDEIRVMGQHLRALHFRLHGVESIDRMGYPAFDEIHHAGVGW